MQIFRYHDAIEIKSPISYQCCIKDYVQTSQCIAFEMKYDYTNGIDTRRLLSEQHNTHYRFFSHDNYTFTIFIGAVFIQILFKKPRL